MSAKRSNETLDEDKSKKPKLEDPKYILPKPVTTFPATLPDRKKNIEYIVREMKILKEWVIPKEKLIKFGYTMEIPKSEPNEKITRECCRCRTEFRLKQQLEPTTCEFHHGTRQKGKYICCLGDMNSTPCSKTNNHVYLLNTPGEKQALKSFQYTTDIFKTKSEYKVLGIDCEMVYTTEGFELARITAIDYFSSKEVLDIFVKPFGEVVDFNTRYSGIKEINDSFLSWDESMEKLGMVMDSSTILIGHSLESDLDIMRLVHTNVIDTSILFPNRWETGPMRKWSLKDLASKFLSRSIQSGEHDSSEDSLAAIDLVKHFVKKELDRKL
ncbi:REX3 RNA exonuclease 3 [Candida maltosa Xu316]